MNNTTKTKKVGFPETTAPAGESFTLNSAVTYINKVRMLSRNRCKCGGKLYIIPAINRFIISLLLKTTLPSR